MIDADFNEICEDVRISALGACCLVVKHFFRIYVTAAPIATRVGYHSIGARIICYILLILFISDRSFLSKISEQFVCQ